MGREVPELGFGEWLVVGALVVAALFLFLATGTQHVFLGGGMGREVPELGFGEWLVVGALVVAALFLFLATGTQHVL